MRRVALTPARARMEDLGERLDNFGVPDNIRSTWKVEMRNLPNIQDLNMSELAATLVFLYNTTGNPQAVIADLPPGAFEGREMDAILSRIVVPVPLPVDPSGREGEVRFRDPNIVATAHRATIFRYATAISALRARS